MSDAPLILGVSGLRGIVGESLTPEVAVRYAGAFGSWLRERVGDAPLVLICRDGRMGGGVMLDAAAAGLRGAGCEVLDCGIQTTPSAGVLASIYECDGAMIATASHNPGEWNGLKCLIEDEQSFSAPDAETANQIIARFQDSKYGWMPSGDIEGRVLEGAECCALHAEYVSSFIAPSGFIPRSSGQDAYRPRVVIDSVNSSGTTVTSDLMQRLGASSIQLHGDGSGIFPHTPEPTKENLSGEGGLCDAVPGLKADVGFAQDPDADRLAIVDERGEYIGEEYTLVLCAMALMEARMGDEAGERRAGSPSHEDQKPVFVVNLSTSRMIDDVAKHYGGEVVRTAVGEANVVEAMKSLKASGRDVVLGGEGNGGVIWPEVTYVRDSLSGMALVLSLMARTGKTVSQLVEMINGLGPTDEVKANGYTIIKKKSALAKKSDADPVVEHLRGIYAGEDDCRVDLQDGIRIDWDAKGVWAHVRASNTEPIMRVIVEAPSADEAEGVASQIDAQIASIGS
ncbi:MAG: phosphohexomutase domain-containing protein [Phycisphaerales bacterium]